MEGAYARYVSAISLSGNPTVIVHPLMRFRLVGFASLPFDKFALFKTAIVL